MDHVLHLPDEVGKQVHGEPDMNAFWVRVSQMALEDRVIAQRLSQSSEQGRRGEYATDEVEAFFAQWSDCRHEG
ncbi:MAG: hypothetical protein HQL75_13415 [Magnetococcales bacterium]|nr:hypothetical protein [Magnetococcales bacterium]